MAIPPEERAAHRSGCVQALEVGLEVLRAGGSSLDAVERAVALLEDDETFDAGYGSFLNSEGVVEVDAGMMDGRTLAVGSVAAVAGLPNPIRLARRVLESPHALLVAEGARRFASEHGVPLCDPRDLICAREQRRWEQAGTSLAPHLSDAIFGTTGAVALDREGNLAAATSTGGYPGKPPGRVGDSPLVGAGVFADNETAAVSATGYGERIIPLVWSKSAADLVGRGAPAADAAHEAVGLLSRIDARAGLIVLDRSGRVGVHWNTPDMAYALCSGSGEVRAGP